MNYKKSYNLLLFGILAGALIAFIGIYIGMKGIWAGSVIEAIGCLMMIGGLVQALLFYKCPACGRRFHIRGRRPDHCPGCGEN